jgi:threonine aldolase
MTQIADFRSDTVTRPSVAMKEAMFSAPLGDDGFGDDPSIIELERLAAEITGKESALFIPSGTMANQIAVAVHTSPGNEILIEERGHISWFEGGGVATNSFVQIRTYLLDKLRLSPKQAQATLRLPIIDCPEMKLLCVENTLNFYGGLVWPLDNLLELKEWAHSKGIAVHLDGARLFNAAIASGDSVFDIAKAADSLMFCLSKGLGAPIGSVLAGSFEFIEKSRRVRKRLGGQMRQAGILAAAGIWALHNNVERLADDHKLAAFIAEKIAKEVPSLTLAQDRVDTNILFYTVPEGVNANDIALELEKEGVLFCPFSDSLLRIVTHLDVTMEDGERLVSLLKRL